jgi:hypothetical protein
MNRGCKFFFSFYHSISSANQLTMGVFFFFSRHSVGRGGAGNLTAGQLPHSEGAVNPHGANHPHATHSHQVDSVGRGGRGNIIAT